MAGKNPARLQVTPSDSCNHLTTEWKSGQVLQKGRIDITPLSKGTGPAPAGTRSAPRSANGTRLEAHAAVGHLVRLLVKKSVSLSTAGSMYSRLS
jgi:hypothetical protein